MPVITRINGIPLFSSIQGALRWGKFNRLKGGYHIHYWEGRKGYMGGNNHSELSNRRPMKIDPIIAARHIANNPLSPRKPARQVQPTRKVQPTPTITTSSSSGGGY